MKDLENNFVPRAIAIFLRDKGFDEVCLAFYDLDHDLCTISSGIRSSGLLKAEAVAAPLWQQVIDWLREEKKIKVDVQHQDFTGGNKYIIWKWNFDNNIGKWERIGGVQSDQDYYKILESGILKAIDLI